MMRTSGGGENENQVKRIFEKLMAKNFSNFQKSMNWHTEVAKWITKRINAQDQDTLYSNCEKPNQSENI